MNKNEEKINILLLLSSVSGGGAQQLTLDYINHYNDEKFNLFVASLRSGNLINLFNKLENNYLCLNQKNRFSIKGFRKLLNYINANRIRIVHTHLLEADSYGFLLKFIKPSIKLISTRHGENRFRKSLKWGIFNFLISLPYSRIVCVSRSLFRFIQNYEFISKKKLILIYNGIDLNYFFKEPQESLRAKYLIDNNKETLLIGVVGRLKKLKGHEVLFNAVRNLKDQGINNIKVLILGEGPQYEKLTLQRKKLKLEREIEFLGFRQGIKKYYNIFDILCLPSFYEGLPLVPVEAMACETIVLCSDIKNNREVIEHGIDGILFKTGDPQDLALKIEQFLSNYYDHEEIKKNARKKVEIQFNIDKNIQKLEKLYESSI
ncbi:MAG: glycosyltransferase family 4 protein [Promethearchaeota archaeon]